MAPKMKKLRNPNLSATLGTAIEELFKASLASYEQERGRKKEEER